MNTELFTGKAEVYEKARPGYPDGAIDYIAALVPPDAVFADIGAGTGKFALRLAERGYTVLAVEPNADMRTQLARTLAPYANARVITGSAEATTLPDGCVDAIVCAQALHWFDPVAFRAECRRIGKSSGLVIAVYNNTPGGTSPARSQLATEVFFSNPVVREFPNPMDYTREIWLAYMSSHSHSPLPSDPGYTEHLVEMNTLFDRESIDGLLRRDVVTRVYSERIRIDA
mgnify:FL=1